MPGQDRFEWYVHVEGYKLTQDQSQSIYFVPVGNGENYKIIYPLTEQGERDRCLYDSLARCAEVNTLDEFNKNLLSFVNAWGCPEFDYRPYKDSVFSPAPVINGESTNRLATLQHESGLLHILLNLLKMQRAHAIEDLSSIFRLEEDGNKSRIAFNLTHPIRHFSGLITEHNFYSLEGEVIANEISSTKTIMRETISSKLTPEELDALAQITIHSFTEDHLRQFPIAVAFNLTNRKAYYHPTSLLSAAWLQFAECIAAPNTEWRPVLCRYCGELEPYDPALWSHGGLKSYFDGEKFVTPKETTYYHKSCYDMYSERGRREMRKAEAKNRPISEI